MSNEPTYTVFIDESGCEGFSFPRSSDWFLISGVITRDRNRAALREVSDEMKRLAGRKKDVKFSGFSGPKRMLIVDMIAARPVRTVTIFVHKPLLTSPETFMAPQRLYFYAVRYLAERISWLCRDAPRRPDENQCARLIFDERKGMPYEDLRSYFRVLQGQYTSIDWATISPERVFEGTESIYPELRVADATVNSFFRAVDPKRGPGPDKCQSAIRLKRVVYRRGVYVGYGLKFYPADVKVADLDLMKAW